MELGNQSEQSVPGAELPQAVWSPEHRGDSQYCSEQSFLRRSRLIPVSSQPWMPPPVFLLQVCSLLPLTALQATGRGQVKSSSDQDLTSEVCSVEELFIGDLGAAGQQLGCWVGMVLKGHIQR